MPYYNLLSYHYEKNRDISEDIAKSKGFILDSGVFTFLNKKKEFSSKVDWEKYVYEYGSYVKKHKIKNYVEVDIDKLIGMDLVDNLRHKLENIVGWQSMPVWHINRGYDVWLKLCKEYNYVCFGAFLTDNLQKNKYHHILKFLDDAKKTGCKVHGLGYTSLEGMKKYRFHSVDSTGWILQVALGRTIVKFNKDKLELSTMPKGRLKIAKLVLHNMVEWVKYSNYLESML